MLNAQAHQLELLRRGIVLAKVSESGPLICAKFTLLFVALALAFSLAISQANATNRSAAARYQFKKLNPCPANGERLGRCPGYVIDHIVPLCADGPDLPENMQWQTAEEAKLKDVLERKICRELH